MIKPLIFKEPLCPLAALVTIRDFEAEFGLVLPEALIEFYLRYNGGIPGEQNKFYPVPREFKEFYDTYRRPGSEEDAGIIPSGFFGLTPDTQTFDVRKEMLSLREYLSIKLFPIADDLFGDCVVLREEDLNGTVYWRDHEMWDPDGINKPWLYPIASDLESFYNGLTVKPPSEDD